MPPSRRTAKSTRISSRSPCKVCNNLDPRGHANSVYHDRPGNSKSKAARVELSLPIYLGDLIRRNSGLSKSKDSCRWCLVLSKVLDEFSPEWKTMAGRLRVVCEMKVGKPIRLILKKGDDHEKTVTEIYRPLNSPSPWQTLGTASEISSNSASQDCFAHIKRWIEVCQTSPEHHKCQSPGQHKQPARLLQIPSDGQSLKLCTKFPKDVKYVALSHCWGSLQPVTTVSTTLKSHLKGISFDDLPPLFQDTVTICRRLDVEYLWIDSLCILQDNHHDWALESSKMSSLYREAHLVIAATTAKDSLDSMLCPRISVSKKIEYENSKGDAFSLRARLVTDNHPVASTNSPANIDGPLMKRAWVLQERVLAKRILHFTQNELMFECMSGFFACECLPSLQKLPTAPALLSGAKKNQHFSDIWQSLVEIYARCNLTRSSDKLPAISGLARALADLDPSINSEKILAHESFLAKIWKTGLWPAAPSEDEYLAGLWRPYVLEQLLWSTAPWLRHPHCAPLVQGRAPSFSWASVDSEIYFAYSPPGVSKKGSKPKNDAFVAEFVAGECSQANEAALNRFGEMASGSITLRGPVMAGTLVAPEPNEYEFYYKFKAPGGIVADVEPDCLLVADSSASVRVRRAQPGETKYCSFKVEAYCIAIAWHESFDMVSGLVLTQSESSTFERIGHFTSAAWPSSAQKMRQIIIR